jgi:hypothetical protein
LVLPDSLIGGKETKELGVRLMTMVKTLSGDGKVVGNTPKRLKRLHGTPLGQTNDSAQLENKLPRKITRLYKSLLNKIPSTRL